MNLVETFEKQNLENLVNKISMDPNKNEINEDQYNEFKNRKNIFKIGDTVRVHYKIVEGKRERIQVYEGYVISVKGKGLARTFKVRKISYGVGVERTFPIFSPSIAKIELIRRGRVRRAKLYYLRKRSGKSAIIKEKINFKN